MDETVQTLPAAIADHTPDLSGHIRLFQDACPHRIVHIMMDVGDLIRQTDNPALQCRRHPGSLVV